MRWLVVTALVGANLLVALLAAGSLLESKRLHEQAAESLTRNIAAALDLNISKDIQKVDFALQSVVDKLEQQLSTGAIRAAHTNTFLAAFEHRLPEVEAIRIARADGLVVFGKGIDPREPVSWADRPSFIHLRDHPGAGIQIFGPVLGRVSKQYVFGFSRRFNHPDGSFAGVVTAPIALSHFTALLAQFNAGPNGTLILRDSGLGLIARVPALPNHPSGQIGNQVVSDDFRQLFDKGASTATGVTSRSPDGFRRVLTFRRLSAVPIVVIAATAQQDYLARWMGELYRTAATAVGFLVLSLLAGIYLLRLMRLNEVRVQQIDEGKSFVTNILDSLAEHIVVVNTQGVIVQLNASWRKFATDNGATNGSMFAIGANYLEVCACVVDGEHSTDAQSAYAGIRAVLDGTQYEYLLEYACHSPTEQRWFILRVLPLLGAQRGAVIIHQNVTRIHLAQAELLASEDKFRLIAENTSDGVIVFDAQQRIQYVSPAYLHQLGYTESEELSRTPQDIHALMHPEDRDQVFASIYAAMEAKKDDLLYSYRIQHRKGHLIWREDHARFSYDRLGNLQNTYVICRDVTSRKTEEDNRRLMTDRLQELSRRLVQAQEHARRHLARELHELTSPNLAALRINLAVLANAVPAAHDAPGFADRVADTRALIDDTTNSIREICSELHSTALHSGGMVGVLHNYALQLAKRTGLQVMVHCTHAETHLAPTLALPLFRIVQEALTNCIKHAQAHTIDITLELAAFPMRVTVRDDGIGFDPHLPQRPDRGMGLMNMRETAEFVGGTLTVHSRSGQGTTVCLDIGAPFQDSIA
jgi:PAS domain S-box-containing protein